MRSGLPLLFDGIIGQVEYDSMSNTHDSSHFPRNWEVGQEGKLMNERLLSVDEIAAHLGAKLKAQRRNLRSLFKDVNWKVMENVKLIDEVLNTTERVLNPGAHGSDSPLYEHEVQKAVDLIKQLETMFTT
jgi:hypothetical protein